MRIPLMLGSLGGKGVVVHRSRPHYLLPDGANCRAGQAFAFFNLGVEVRAGAARQPFAEERTLQVVVAPAVAGALRYHTATDEGLRDAFSVYPWREDEVVAHLDIDPPNTAEGPEAPDRELSTLRLLFLAGQRMAWAVDSDAALLPAWNARARAWWEAPASPSMRRLLCVGLCEASSVIRGARAGFLELFEMMRFSAHVAQISEHPLVPCAPVLMDQLQRGARDIEAMGQDLARSFADGPPPTPEDWIFVGALMRQLTASPLRQSRLCLTRGGLEEIAPPQHVVLSSAAEPFRLYRHCRLGYHIHILAHDLRAAGPASRHWLKKHFEPVERDIAGIRRDYERLVALAATTNGARFMVINRVSSSAGENIVSYAAFAPPVSARLAYVAAKEINLMLEDFAARGDIAVIDADAIAANLGVDEHAPGGMHFSQEMEAILRAEIIAACGA